MTPATNTFSLEKVIVGNIARNRQFVAVFALLEKISDYRIGAAVVAGAVVSVVGVVVPGVSAAGVVVSGVAASSIASSTSSVKSASSVSLIGVCS